MFHTNLEVSKKLQEMGVKVESEKNWHVKCNESWIDEFEDLSNEPELKVEQCPAYSLDEMAEVLKKVGHIKKWAVTNARYGYIPLCEIYYDKGEAAANEYLLSIL